MIKLLKQTLVSLLVTVITVIAVYGGYTIYAQAEPNYLDETFDSYLSIFNKYYEDVSYFFIFDEYHKVMNNFFNAKLKALNELMESENFYNDPEKKRLLDPPENAGPKQELEKDKAPNLDDILAACGDKNVSSYCVSMQALDIYLQYVQKLNSMEGTLEQSNGSNDIRTVLELTRQRDTAIDEEVVSAKKVMEATMAAYNEYHLAYPMHVKYKEVLKNLVKYKLALKDIRKRVVQFPVRFMDASTTDCE